MADITTAPVPTPIALGPGEGENLWFLGNLVTIKSTAETTAGGVAVIEHLGPKGAGSPLHVHHNEDEWFYVIDGDITFWCGGKVVEGTAGSFVYGPRDIPHTFQVQSETARWLLVTEPAGFEAFMRAFAQPAERHEIPPSDLPMPAADELARVALDYGIEVLGPPGIPAPVDAGQNPQDVVARLYAAFGAGDVPTVMGMLDLDIDWLETPGLPWGGPKTGPRAVAEGVFVPTMQLVPDFRVDPEEIYAHDDTVTVIHRYTGNNGKLDSLGCGVWTVREGRITRYRQFVDSATFNASIKD